MPSMAAIGRTPTTALVMNAASTSASCPRVTGAVLVSAVRGGRFGDGGVGIGEQHIVEAVALRDAPMPQRTEQPCVFDGW